METTDKSRQGSKSVVNALVIPFDLFLDKSNERLKEPWTDGEFAYHSDGHCMLRTPPDASILAPPPFDIKMPWPIAFIAMESMKPPIIKKEKCHYCKGSGEVLTCHDCDGSGYITWTVGRHDYEADCIECEGSGFVNSSDGDRCEECNGSGFIDKIDVLHRVGERGISNILLKKLCALPNLKLSTQLIGQNMFYFTFSGGDGIAMASVV